MRTNWNLMLSVLLGAALSIVPAVVQDQQGLRPSGEPLAPPSQEPAKNAPSEPKPAEFHIDLDMGETFATVPPGWRSKVIREMIVGLLQDHSNLIVVDAVKRTLPQSFKHVAIVEGSAVPPPLVEYPPTTPVPAPLLPATPGALDQPSEERLVPPMPAAYYIQDLKAGESFVFVSVGSPDCESPKGPYRVPIGLQISPTPKQAQYKSIIQSIQRKLAADIPGYSERFVKDALTWNEEREADLRRLQIERDMAPLSAGKVEEQLANFGQQQTAARLAFVGIEARAKALTEELKQTEARAQRNTEGDDVLVSLARLLALREQQVERTKALAARNSVSQKEVQDAEAEMLSAKIEYAKRREALMRANGGDRLDALNDELGHVSVERAETTARLKYLEEASAAMANALNERHRNFGDKETDADRVERAVEQIDSIDRETRELRQLKAVQGRMKFERARVILQPEDAPAAAKPKQ